MPISLYNLRFEKKLPLKGFYFFRYGSFFFQLTRNAEQQDNTQKEKDHQKQNRIPHASCNLIDEAIKEHPDDNPYLFSNIIKTEIRGGVLCFG